MKWQDTEGLDIMVGKPLSSTPGFQAEVNQDDMVLSVMNLLCLSACTYRRPRRLCRACPETFKEAVVSEIGTFAGGVKRFS